MEDMKKKSPAKTGGLALLFEVVSTFALVIGLAQSICSSQRHGIDPAAGLVIAATAPAKTRWSG
jgi:hypothetical protein